MAVNTGAPVGRSQTDVVIETVKSMLREGTLRAGDRIPIERELALQLGVSRGSLREAIRALIALGVLEARQGDGTYVTSLDSTRLLSPVGFYAELHGPSSAVELLAVRRVLEAESAALAATRLLKSELDELEAILARVDEMFAGTEEPDAERTIEADVEFHRLIARASGNTTLAGLIDNLSTRTIRTRLWRSHTHRASIRAAHLQHRAILAALVERDPSRAQIRMSTHLLDVEDFVAAHRAGASLDDAAALRPEPRNEQAEATGQTSQT